MPTQPKVRQYAIAHDEMSTAAAAAQLRAETRAFGNAAAKLNLKLATAAFQEAKESFYVQSSHSTEAASKVE